jgi:hypothetical protein
MLLKPDGGQAIGQAKSTPFAPCWVAVTLEIWPDMIHAWPMWNAHLEPGRRALANAGGFIRRRLQREVT